MSELVFFRRGEEVLHVALPSSELEPSESHI